MAGTGVSIDFAPPCIVDADVEAVTRVLNSGWLTSGLECELLEDQLAAYLGIDHVVALSSCTAALDTAVAFLGLPPGGRVGVPTWTFVATALSAVNADLEVVLLDVDPDTLNLSPDALRRAAEVGLDAVVSVHFAGTPMAPAIHEVCTEFQLPLVEDAAHALGSSDHRGRVAGRRTAGACFSFYASKNLTSAEGGALATDDHELARFARRHRLHGLERQHPVASIGDTSCLPNLVAPGIKANLPDVLAALARSQLSRFDAMQASRRELVKRYRANLASISGLRCVPGDLDLDSSDHLMVIVLPEGSSRHDVMQALLDEHIASSVHFRPLHHMDWFVHNAQVGPGGTEVADRLAERALSLPLHLSLTVEDVDRVCAVVARSLGAS